MAQPKSSEFNAAAAEVDRRIAAVRVWLNDRPAGTKTELEFGSKKGNWKLSIDRVSGRFDILYSRLVEAESKWTQPVPIIKLPIMERAKLLPDLADLIEFLQESDAEKVSVLQGLVQQSDERFASLGIEIDDDAIARDQAAADVAAMISNVARAPLRKRKAPPVRRTEEDA